MTLNQHISLRTMAVLLLPSLLSASASGQDTSRKTIEITSSFKPVLRNAAKINFNATPPAADTTRPRLQYNVPAQNVFPRLAPVGIKPLALPADSSAWANSNYIKAGYGNLQTPYLEAGISVPAGSSRINILANHISSNGRIEFQNYAETGVKGYFSRPINKDVEFHANVGFEQDKYYQYGYDRNRFNFEREDLLRRYSTISAEAGVRNPTPTEFGLTYSPKLNIDVFSDNLKNSETNARLNVPVEKFIGNSFGIRLGVMADLTRLSLSGGGRSISNNLFTIPVGLSFRTPNLKFHAGIIPSWDNGVFKLLPNILVDLPVSGEKWIIQAGWISYFNKGSYQRFAGMNPYMAPPLDLRNNRMIERYVGFKGTLLNHFSYNAKVGYAEFRNVPLFVNDTASGRSFNVLLEEQLKAIQLQGEFGVVEAERFSLSARFNYYKFNAQRTAERAWSLIPLELSSHLRWNVIRDLWLTSDFYLWDGPLYTNLKGSEGRLPGAVDLNAGLEFRLTRNIFLWTQFNNIFNSKYQRWHQYDNYGFNMLLGGIYRFNQ